MQPKPKNNLVCTKSLIEILSFLRIEKDGTEIKNNLLQPNIQHYIRIADNTYKLEEKKTEIKTEFEIKKKNKEGQKIFSCLLTEIYKIVDCQSNQGKLTILIEKNKQKYNIMLFKSTKEILEHFLGKLLTVKNNISKNLNLIKSESEEKPIDKKPLNNNLINFKKSNVYGKRKYNELYKKQKSDINLKRKKENKGDIIPLNIKNLNLFKDIQRINKETSITIIYLCEVFPDYLTYQIFNFLDIKSLLWKVCLINKELKKICDSYIDKVKLKDDTPNEVFHRILSRFSNTRNIILGKAKNFNNSNIKEMIGSLKYLQHLDISNLENINDKSIHRLLVKTRGVNILSLKLNAFLESMHEALCYCLNFYKNMIELSLVNNKFRATEKDLQNISENKRYYRRELMETLLKLLKSNLHHIQKLNLFVFNGVTQYTHIQINSFPFKNLIELSIDLLIIKEVKELQILYHCEKLEKFKLGEIAIQSNNNVLNYIDIDDILNKQFVLEEENNGEIDFDNVPTEVFGKIFYYMKNLKEINCGNFLTNEICQLISVYLKKLEKITISSDYITDEAFKQVLMNCKEIREIDLRGCDRFLGDCFFELRSNEFPQKLIKAKFSVQNYNFYHVTNLLIKKGIKAENYISSNKNK